MFLYNSMPFRPISKFWLPRKNLQVQQLNFLSLNFSYSTFNYTIKTNTLSINTTMHKHQKCLLVDTNSNSSSLCLFAVTADMACKESTDFDVEVANAGNMNSTDIVIIYRIPPLDTDVAPIKQMAAFQTTGSHKQNSFSIDMCQRLSFVEKTACGFLPTGLHTIAIEDGSFTFPVQLKLSRTCGS